MRVRNGVPGEVEVLVVVSYREGRKEAEVFLGPGKIHKWGVLEGPIILD